MDTSRLAWLPNAVTVARMLSLPPLVWLAWNGMQSAFSALLVAALASDVVDGWLARRLNVESRLGATLDSVADILLVLVMVFAIWPLHPYVYEEHPWPILGVVAIWIVAHLASLVRYGRLASFHTYLIRAGIFSFSVFALVLFLFGFVPWLLYLAAAVCALGAVEHFVMLLLLPEWIPDLHGGVPEALRRRRSFRER
jgi:cardiolipin synthase